MLGRRPYVGRNRKEIREQILSKQAAIKVEDLPSKWSPEGADLINKVWYIYILVASSKPFK